MTSSGPEILKNFKNVKFDPLELKNLLLDDPTTLPKISIISIQAV